MSVKYFNGFMQKIFLAFVIVCYGPSSSINAADQNPSSHEHGVGAVNIAFESGEIEIELEVPAEDIVGFENKPVTKSELASVKKGVSKLEQGDQIFIFPKSAGCVLEKTEIASVLIEKGADDHGHDDKHDHGHTQGHQESENNDQETHSEFLATYHFNCKNTDKVDYIFIEFFKMFSATEKLLVQFVSPSGQGAATVTPNSTKITLN